MNYYENNENKITQTTPFFKILLLGESNVGKTCLKVRYVDDTFPLDYKATIGVDYKIKLVNINSKEAVKLSIWDTAGQERYRSISKSYMHNSQAIILCYDITDRGSYDEIINYWLPLTRNTVHSTECTIIIVGNKLDKKNFRKVTNEEAKEFCDINNLKYFETSAMKNLNVEELFITIAKEINFKQEEKIKRMNEKRRLKENEKEKGNNKNVTTEFIEPFSNIQDKSIMSERDRGRHGLSKKSKCC